ncbi:MAG: hypothetical protein QW734_06425 [Candidatus Bathyarchaeia archaeon]
MSESRVLESVSNISYTRYGRLVVSRTPVTVLQANPKRISLVVVNHGNYDLYVGFDNDIANREGFYVEPHGGHVSIRKIEDGEMVTRQILACAPDGDCKVWFVEEVEV